MQWRNSDVTVMLQWCYSGVTVVLQKISYLPRVLYQRHTGLIVPHLLARQLVIIATVHVPPVILGRERGQGISEGRMGRTGSEKS
jgi:hypothetical protein